MSRDRGISREADLLVLAQDDKLIDKSGSWFNYGEIRLGQGAENVKQYLRDNPALMEELTRKILEKRGLTGAVGAPASNGEPVVAEAPAAPAEPGKGEGQGAAGGEQTPVTGKPPSLGARGRPRAHAGGGKRRNENCTRTRIASPCA